MTDDELVEFCIPGADERERDLFLQFMSQRPEKRKTYEAMARLCDDLYLWETGVAPKPEYAIICGPKQVRGAGIEKTPKKAILYKD